MTKNIETNTTLNIDEALRFHSRLHYEISRALKQDDLRKHISVDFCETLQKVMLVVPLEFSFQGEKITRLRASLWSADAFKWQYDEEEVSDDDVAQFSVSFTNFNECSPIKYDEFDLHLSAEDIVPILQQHKEEMLEELRDEIAEVKSLASSLEPDLYPVSEIEQNTHTLRDIKGQLEAI